LGKNCQSKKDISKGEKTKKNCKGTLILQGVAGHPSRQGGGPEKNNWNKWTAEEEERHRCTLMYICTFAHM
jgi:hypothetical protein